MPEVRGFSDRLCYLTIAIAGIHLISLMLLITS